MLSLREIKRVDQILIVLFEEGFGYIIDRIGLSGRIPLHKRIHARLKGPHTRTNEERLRETFERLGPTFIKLGQLLSLRPDLIPTSYCRELEKLQDNTPAMPVSSVRAAVEKELRVPISNVFSKFDYNPIASASISQVHRAVLKNNQKVAVKIQKVGTEREMMADIRIMRHIAAILVKHNAFHKVNAARIVDEFARWTSKELDFTNEAENQMIIRDYFRDSKTVYVPKVYRTLCTKELLVSEFIDGVKLHDFRLVKKANISAKKLLHNGMDAILTMVFVHGFFHADPHPGNILVLKDGRICLLDFGIVGYFDDKLREKATEMFLCMMDGDVDGLVNIFSKMGMSGSEDDIDAFRLALHHELGKLHVGTLEDVKISYVLENILEKALDAKVHLPISFVLFGKTLVTLEGIGLMYNPQFSLTEEARPFLAKLAKKKYNPRKKLGRLKMMIDSYKNLFEGIPAKAEKILSTLEKGSIRLDISDQIDTERIYTELGRGSNRISYSLVVAAFIIAGSLLVDLNIQPKLYSLNIVTVTCYLIAAIFLLMLFASIIGDTSKR